MTAPQITPLLANRDLDRLARLRLNVARHFTNRGRGEHLAARGGTSTEFCDYRDYTPGDDVRFVDWNIFARIERPYLKQFHHEEERHVALLVDASRSMLFEGKLDLGRRLAAALGVIALRGHERVSAFAIGAAAGEARMQPARGRPGQGRLFAFLEGITAGGTTPLETGIESFLRQHSGRGSAIVISDFLTAGDLRRAFNLLHSAGLEVLALQILGPTELAPELTDDHRLIDSETLEPLDISASGDLLALYLEYRAAQEAQLATLCRQRAGRYLLASAAEPLEHLVFDRLRRAGWIA